MFTLSMIAQNWSGTTIVATDPVYVYELASGDLNGDGFDDIITTTTATDLTLHWYLNDGAGNFTQYSYDANFRGVGMTIYDLDGDGDLDIIGVGIMTDITDTEGIALWENDGNNLPVFTRHDIYKTTTRFDGGRSTRVYDADNDGDMDIIAGSYSDDRVSYFKNPGTPTTLGWTKVDILSGSTDADGINFVDIGDADGDNDTDVVVTVYTADKITIKQRTGSSSYTSRVVTTGYDAPTMTKFAGDLDGDGHNDLISTSTGTSDKLSWWKNGGNISAGASNWTENTLYTGEPSYGVISYDIDNDGDLDIFAGIASPSGSYEDIVWYENDGVGNFTLETIYSNKNIYENYGFNMFLTFGDVNNDGKMDLIVTAANNDTKGDVFYFLNEMTITLPINLIDFTAKHQGGETLLDWSTSSEHNNDYFTIERSKDGLLWEELIDVDGAGNSSNLLHYSTNDRDPYTELSYYRVKQTDFNGEYSYSQIEAINIKGTNNSIFTAFPNPFKTSFNLHFFENTEYPITIGIYDQLGRKVYKKLITEQVETVEIDFEKNFPKGAYFIKVNTNLEQMVKKIIKK